MATQYTMNPLLPSSRFYIVYYGQPSTRRRIETEEEGDYSRSVLGLQPEERLKAKFAADLDKVQEDILPMLKWQFRSSDRSSDRSSEDDKKTIGLSYKAITPADEEQFEKVRPNFEGEDNAAYFYGELYEDKLVMDAASDSFTGHWILGAEADEDLVAGNGQVKTNCVVLSEDQFHALTAADLKHNGGPTDWYNFDSTKFESYGFCPDKPEDLATSEPKKWMQDPRMLEFREKRAVELTAKSLSTQVLQDFEGPNSEYMLRPGVYFAILMELPAGVTGVISQDKVP